METYWGKDIKDVKEETEFSKESLHHLLMKVDPVMSNFLSKHDTRKVLNTLRKFYRGQGTILESDKWRTPMKLRYPCIFIHLKADVEVL